MSSSVFFRGGRGGESASGVRSNGLCPQSVFAAGGLVPVGFKHSWLSTSHYLLEKHKLCDGDSSECEARERLLAAVSAADALPRGTAFEKVKGARDRLRGSVQRTDEDELVKSATASAHRLNQRLSRMRKLGMDAPADAPEPAEAPMKTEPAAPEPAPAEAPMKTEPAAPEPAPAKAPMKPEPAPAEAPMKPELRPSPLLRRPLLP